MKPAALQFLIAITRLSALDTGKNSRAPAADLKAAGVIGEVLSTGKIIPEIPEHSADLAIAPTLKGSLISSKAISIG